MKLWIVILAMSLPPRLCSGGPAAWAPASGVPAGVPAGDEACWSEPVDLNDFKISSEVIGALGIESELANDFVIPFDATIERARGYGGYYAWVPGDPPITGCNWRFYDDAEGTPGELLFIRMNDLGVETFLGYNGYGEPTYQYEIQPELEIQENRTYWFSLQASDHPFPPQWGRQGTGAVVTGWPAMFRSAYFGYPDWIPVEDLIGSAFDAAQEFDCATPTGVLQRSWGRVRSLYR